MDNIDYFSKIYSPNLDQPNDDLHDFINTNYINYDWPGNVRELRNLVERITILSSNESKEKINQVIDDDVLEPVAKGYRAITPDPIEDSVSNFSIT